MIKANKLYIMLSIVKGCGPMVFILHDGSGGGGEDAKTMVSYSSR